MIVLVELTIFLPREHNILVQQFASFFIGGTR